MTQPHFSEKIFAHVLDYKTSVYLLAYFFSRSPEPMLLRSPIHVHINPVENLLQAFHGYFYLTFYVFRSRRYLNITPFYITCDVCYGKEALRQNTYNFIVLNISRIWYMCETFPSQSRTMSFERNKYNLWPDSDINTGINSPWPYKGIVVNICRFGIVLFVSSTS